MIPKVTGSQRRFNFIPEKETPAFAKAKIGKIIKFTHGAIECSKFSKGECDELSLEFSGINCANSTPAKLACIPDFNTKIHSKIPTIISVSYTHLTLPTILRV